MRGSNFGYFLAEGFRGIFLHGFMSFAATGIIVASLLIMGSFSLLAANIQYMIGELEKDNEIYAYIDDGADEAMTEEIGRKIAAIPNVRSCTFVTREEAADHFAAEYEEYSGLFDSLDPTIFRNRYAIHIVDIQEMAQTVSAIREVGGVANVRAILEISDGMVTIRNVVSVVCAALISVLLVVSVFIISNTVKLAAFTRRQEIAIMKMCGATNGFIRAPFIFEGLILGFFGAVIAFFCQWGLYAAIERAIAMSDRMSLVDTLPFVGLAQPVALIFLAIGLVVGVCGSALTIRKFMDI